MGEIFVASFNQIIECYFIKESGYAILLYASASEGDKNFVAPEGDRDVVAPKGDRGKAARRSTQLIQPAVSCLD